MEEKHFSRSSSLALAWEASRQDFAIVNYIEKGKDALATKYTRSSNKNVILIICTLYNLLLPSNVYSFTF